jgi:amidophosphoribosyltransferase
VCGIFGIEGSEDAANLTYLGLYALQHRGQESAGIVSFDGERLYAHRGMGHVSELFDSRVLAGLLGCRAIGHTRYSTAGHSILSNAQPIVVNTSMGPLGIVHNGNLTNAVRLRSELEETGSIFQTTSDTEIILHLMARNPRNDWVESLLVALREVEGAFSLLVLGRDALVAVRDPYGFRPLLLGDAGGSPCFASETCAFDLIGARLERELQAGEAVIARGSDLSSVWLARPAARQARCIFEQVYFARPDSQVFGEPVSQARIGMGRRLAREAPADADVVVAVPDSGLFAALGYSRESGLPLEFGLIRNHYVGRTFIEPKQSIRHFGVKIKLNPVREIIEGRRIVLIDDSVVRGTTAPKIVKMVRDAGAKEVHLRISCPPTRWPCHYGIDMPTREELIATNHSLDEIAQLLGADSIGYLSLDGMLASVKGAADSYCTACWTGEYPVAIDGGTRHQRELFPIRTEAGD